ncbi:disulfide bond formation protein DsbA [Nocardia puris]|uniref:mycothiol-dependent nitroreductase Rv2466c family protein n=1 Tax=Nocardia puris TaxID=208602 RepID=UPI001892F60C|nr:disulfide bond formation protein DsbA [Nocardia puris]MBF6364367.1 disulfide bond formation protein DsbA [Nocardia puris]MBF6459296.1 disulfide bond formation protein DsbA [Nocardia puris]
MVHRVELFVDPACPYTWIAYRWLSEEVHQRRPIALRLRLMSLHLLNTAPAPDYRAQLAVADRLTHLAAGIRAAHGEATFTRFYREFGRTFFTPAHTDIVIAAREDQRPWATQLTTAVDAALHTIGLEPPADITAAGATLRAEHAEAIAAVGTDVGTPVLRIDGAACFGPVLSAVPRGRDALDLFDGVRLLTAHRHFFELKRTRLRELSFH